MNIMAKQKPSISIVSYYDPYGKKIKNNTLGGKKNSDNSLEENVVNNTPVEDRRTFLKKGLSRLFILGLPLLIVNKKCSMPKNKWIMPKPIYVPTWMPTEQPTAEPTSRPTAVPTARPTIPPIQPISPGNTIYCLINLFGENVSDVENTEKNRKIVKNQEEFFLSPQRTNNFYWDMIPMSWGYVGNLVNSKLFENNKICDVLLSASSKTSSWKGDNSYPTDSLEYHSQVLSNKMKYFSFENVLFIGTDTPKSKEDLAFFVNSLKSKGYRPLVCEDLFIGIPQERKEEWKSQGILYDNYLDMMKKVLEE